MLTFFLRLRDQRMKKGKDFIIFIPQFEWVDRIALLGKIGMVSIVLLSIEVTILTGFING